MARLIDMYVGVSVAASIKGCVALYPANYNLHVLFGDEMNV